MANAWSDTGRDASRTRGLDYEACVFAIASGFMSYILPPYQRVSVFFYPSARCESPNKNKQTNKPLKEISSSALWKLGRLDEAELALGSIKLPSFNNDEVPLSDLKRFAYSLVKIMNFTRVEKVMDAVHLSVLVRRYPQ